MAPTNINPLHQPPLSDQEFQDRIQLYIDGVPDQPDQDSIPTLGSPFCTPPASTLGSPYAAPSLSLVGNEEYFFSSPAVVDWDEVLVSFNMSSSASIAGSSIAGNSDGINPSVASGQDNKVGMDDNTGARDGADKVIKDSNSDTETVIADTPPSQGTTGNTQTDKNVGVGADQSAQDKSADVKPADVKSPAASSKEGSHVSGMHLSKYAPKPTLADWPPQIPRGPRAAKIHNAPRAPRVPQNSGYQGQNQNFGQANLHDKVRTLEGELREVRQALEAERKATKAAVEKAQVRADKYCDIAVQQLLSDIIIDKMRLVKQTEHLHLKETELAARKENIRNIEGMLTIGQKQSATNSEGQSVADFVDVNEEIIRGRVAYEQARRDAKSEARLAAKEKELEVREAGIEYREKVAPTIVARALEKVKADIRAELEEEMAIRMASKTEQQRHGYGQGFAECLETMILMKEFRSGEISHNDPKVAFIFDPTHPKNPVARAMEVIHYRMDNAVSSSAFATPVNVNRGNATQFGGQRGSNSSGYRSRQSYLEVYHEDPNVAAAQFGTRTAEPLVPDLAGQPPVPAAERTPATTKTNAANDSTPEDREPPHVAVPGFSAVPTPRRAAPDERVHKEDKTVDLIDLY